MKKVKITINKKDGSIVAEADGFKTNKCTEALEFLNQILVKNELTNKPEFYQETIQEIQNN